MDDKVYRLTEIVGTSAVSVEQAIRNGVGRAAKTLRHLDWFEVTQVRGALADGQVQSFQVTMKVGFCIDDNNPDS